MYEDRIAKGIQLLNAKGPEGWREKINRDSISMIDPYLCVLGQVCGSYWDALDALGLKIPYEGTTITNWARTEVSISSYGFLLDDLGANSDNYVILANEWAEALADDNRRLDLATDR